MLCQPVVLYVRRLGIAMVCMGTRSVTCRMTADAGTTEGYACINRAREDLLITSWP